MLGEVGLQGETLAALEAGERFIRGVSLNVSPQVALVSEGFVAEVAAEWFLPTVQSSVLGQVVFVFESLLAIRAFVWPQVCNSSNLELFRLKHPFLCENRSILPKYHNTIIDVFLDFCRNIMISF